MRENLRVFKQDKKWIIAGKSKSVFVDEVALDILVKTSSAEWAMKSANPFELKIQKGTLEHNISLKDSKHLQISPYQHGGLSGIKAELSDFVFENQTFDFKLFLFICMDEIEEDLIVRVAVKEDIAKVKAFSWPGPFNPEENDFAVLPIMQGVLLPKNWNQKIPKFPHHWPAHCRTMYMPWWGHQKGKSAVMAIIETPDDAGWDFEHPCGGPTKIGIRWDCSLGEFKYSRSIRYCFFENGNYVTLAKRYRRYIKEKGQYISLKEKIARNPIVAKLIGAPVVHEGILYNTLPNSPYYNKENPASNYKFTSFSVRAEQLEDLKRNGFDRVYFHLDGWGLIGYDRLHPSPLPPCKEAGGWDGMKKLSETCKKLDYVFVIHDQYRDFYHDSPEYNPNLSVIDKKGERFSHAVWGGPQDMLCASLALDFLKSNYLSILKQGIEIQGAYLDVFACCEPDECYHPEHPMTRYESLKYRGECFDFIRSQGGVASSEEPVDWAIKHLDIVHHAPFFVASVMGETMGENSEAAVGIPIPLFNLVYHDSIFVPWTLAKGIWGIPKDDLGLLHALLNGGMPYLSITPENSELERVKVICDLHKKVAMLEMVDHKFLDSSYRKQISIFDDGTTVEIDFSNDSYRINERV